MFRVCFALLVYLLYCINIHCMIIVCIQKQRKTSHVKENSILIITSVHHTAQTRCMRQTVTGVWLRTFPSKLENNTCLNAQLRPKEIPPNKNKTNLTFSYSAI